MKLPEKLAAFRRNFEAGGPPYNAPAWIHEPMHRATAELVASHAADRALKAGDRAPQFALPDADGRLHRSEELLARGPLVLSFYRGVWCPYCNLDLQALQEALPQIEALGDALIDRAVAETGLPKARIQGERGRTCTQLRTFARTVRAGEWLDVRVDSALPERQPLPRADLRQRQVGTAQLGAQ